VSRRRPPPTPPAWAGCHACLASTHSFAAAPLLKLPAAIAAAAGRRRRRRRESDRVQRSAGARGEAGAGDGLPATVDALALPQSRPPSPELSTLGLTTGSLLMLEVHESLAAYICKKLADPATAHLRCGGGGQRGTRTASGCAARKACVGRQLLASPGSQGGQAQGQGRSAAPPPYCTCLVALLWTAVALLLLPARCPAQV
jgi:hypothetical protein